MEFLRREAVLKARSAALGTLVLILISAFQTFVVYDGPRLGLAIVGLGISFCLARLALVRRVKQRFGTAGCTDPRCFGALMILTRLSALTFSVWIAFLHHSFGSDHPTFFLSLILLSGLASSATATLATHPRIFAQYAALLFVAWLPVGLIHHFEVEFLLLAFVSVAFISFLFTTVKTLHAALVTQSNEVSEARQQADLVESYLRAFPGHVSVLDKDLNYVFVSQDLKSNWGSEPIRKKLGWKNADSDFAIKVKNFARGSESKVQFETIIDDLQGSAAKHFQIYLSRIAERNEILCLAVNIDERVALEAERQRDRVRLESSSRLASLGEMAAGLAHEVNNPLAIIDGNLELLRKWRNDEQKFAIKLSNVKSAVDRIAKIVRAMRVFARKEDRDVPELLSVDSVVESVVALAQERIKKRGIELGTSLNATSVISLQEVALGQILINLLNNAVDAVENVNHKKIEVVTRESNDLVEILVSDSGPGINSTLREKIMEPFFTTKAVGKGTGLGLSVSLRLAEAMGGALELQEGVPQTCFAIKIPRRAA